MATLCLKKNYTHKCFATHNKFTLSNIVFTVSIPVCSNLRVSMIFVVENLAFLHCSFSVSVLSRLMIVEGVHV